MFAVLAGWLVVDSARVEREHGFLFAGGKINQVLPNDEILRLAKENQYEIFDYRDQVVCPGFVNSHMHQYGVLSHGMTPKITIRNFESFLEDYWWPDLENKVSLKHVLATTFYTAMESLESGVVSIFDVLEAPLAEEGVLIEQGKVLEKMGMRAIVSLESSERISSDNGRRCLSENKGAIRYFQENSRLIRGAVSAHTTFSCSDSFIEEAVMTAKGEDAIFHFHLSESSFEPDVLKSRRQVLPAELYCRLGALYDRTLASQCVKVNEKEIELLAKTNTCVSHMPISNCEVGGGIAPVPKMLDAGIPVGLGSDGYVNDFFSVMRAAFLIHKAHLESTTVMPARLVFKMATEMGSRCMGYHGGTLNEGAAADFIVMADLWPTEITRDNIYDQIVVYGKKEFIKHVFIAGNMVYNSDKNNDQMGRTTLQQLKLMSHELWEQQKTCK